MTDEQDLVMTTDLLSVRDVAALTGLTEGTIRTYLYRKTMPVADGRVGQSPVWRREPIDRWLAARQARSPADGPGP